GVISDFLFPIAVSVSAITTFTTPYFIYFFDHTYNGIVKFLPSKWLSRLEDYTAETQENTDSPLWQEMLQAYYRILLINGIILIAIVLLYKYLLIPFIEAQISSPLWQNIIIIVSATILAAPFLWAILIKKINVRDDNETVNSDLL